jgi:hypothetical protein
MLNIDTGGEPTGGLGKLQTAPAMPVAAFAVKRPTELKHTAVSVALPTVTPELMAETSPDPMKSVASATDPINGMVLTAQ